MAVSDGVELNASIRKSIVADTVNGTRLGFMAGPPRDFAVARWAHSRQSTEVGYERKTARAAHDSLRGRYPGYCLYLMQVLCLKGQSAGGASLRRDDLRPLSPRSSTAMPRSESLFLRVFRCTPRDRAERQKLPRLDLSE